MDKIMTGQNLQGKAFYSDNTLRKNATETIPALDNGKKPVERITIEGPRTKIRFDITKYTEPSTQQILWDLDTFYEHFHDKGRGCCSDFVDGNGEVIRKDDEFRFSRNLIYLSWLLEKIDQKVVCVAAGYNGESFIFACNQNQDVLKNSILKLKSILNEVNSQDSSSFESQFKSELVLKRIDVPNLEKDKHFQRCLVNLKELKNFFLSKDSIVLMPKKVALKNFRERTPFMRELTLKLARNNSANSGVLELDLPYIYGYSDTDLQRITGKDTKSVALDLHAEMQVVQFFKEYPTGVKMVGISKRPCLKCAAAFSILNEEEMRTNGKKFLAIEESHGNSVDCWVVPPFIRRDAKLTQEFLGPLYTLYQMLAQNNENSQDKRFLAAVKVPDKYAAIKSKFFSENKDKAKDFKSMYLNNIEITSEDVKHIQESGGKIEGLKISSEDILEDIFTLIEFGFNGRVPQDPANKSATNSRRHSIAQAAPG